MFNAKCGIENHFWIDEIKAYVIRMFISIEFYFNDEVSLCTEYKLFIAMPVKFSLFIHISC